MGAKCHGGSSLYCDIKAFARRPAMEVVRIIIDERSAGRNYQHRLMDYNNDRARLTQQPARTVTAGTAQG
jgi:hypothetical protein